MHENKYNSYTIPSGLLIVFLEKALTLMHMETHLNDNEEIKICNIPFTLLNPHYCDSSIVSKERGQNDIEQLLEQDQQILANNLNAQMSKIMPF